MWKLHVTSSRFCLYLPNIYYFTYTFSHAHTEAHTHTSTHVQSAHKRKGDNQAQEPGWEGRKKGFVRDLAHTHKKKCQKTPIFTDLKKRFEHIELPAKLLDYFLRSNKSNINQREDFSWKNAPQAIFFNWKKQAEGKTYQTTCAAGQIFGLIRVKESVLLLLYMIQSSKITAQNIFPLIN